MSPANGEAAGNGKPSVELRGVTKRFGDFTAVDGVDLDIAEGEFFTMLGPSGCGKTTTLRMVAGFEEPTEGQVLIDGADVVGLPPYRRPTNTVFQSYALFPHLSVSENVAFGLKRKGVDKAEVKRRVEEELERVRPRRARPTAAPRSSPAASSSASPWRGRWSTCRRSCCSTSRSARST